MNPSRTTALLLAGLLVFLASTTAIAATAKPREEQRSIDAQRSHAEFVLKAMLVVGVRGRFGEVSGALHIDHFSNHGWVDAVIDADAVQMDDPDREDWARSKEFFDTASYPTVLFKSDPIPLQRLRTGGDLPGTLTLRGVSRPLTLTLLHGQCRNPGADCAIRALGNIVRSEFGMRSKRAVLGDRVQLDLSVYLEAESTQP